MADERCFVQFSHPGGEHRPDRSGSKAWNTLASSHARKFMQFPGRWIASDDSPHRGELWAWGEWEPESRLIRELDRPRGNRDYPRYLWQPCYVLKDDYRGLHNTDPFIFGERFLYSNCRQRANPGLMRLGEGSVIAFGSGKQGVGGEWRWWLDTVLVVANSDLYAASGACRMLKDWTSDVFGIVTGGPLADKHEAGCAADVQLRLYRGATPDDPVDGNVQLLPRAARGWRNGLSATGHRPAKRVLQPPQHSGSQGDRPRAHPR